jgi:hypothetical protein
MFARQKQPKPLIFNNMYHTCIIAHMPYTQHDVAQKRLFVCKGQIMILARVRNVIPVNWWYRIPINIRECLSRLSNHITWVYNIITQYGTGVSVFYLLLLTCCTHACTYVAAREKTVESAELDNIQLYNKCSPLLSVIWCITLSLLLHDRRCRLI